MPRELKGNHCSHAVAKEGKRFIEVWIDLRHDCLDQRQQTAKGFLVHAVASARQLKCAEFYPGRQTFGPLVERPGVTAGIRKAEEPQARGWVFSWKHQPSRRPR